MANLTQSDPMVVTRILSQLPVRCIAADNVGQLRDIDQLTTVEIQLTKQEVQSVCQQVFRDKIGNMVWDALMDSNVRQKYPVIDDISLDQQNAFVDNVLFIFEQYARQDGHWQTESPAAMLEYALEKTAQYWVSGSENS